MVAMSQNVPKRELLVPKEEAESRIRDRIAKGVNLSKREITTAVQFVAANREYYHWSDYNEELLKSIFTDPSIAGDYVASDRVEADSETGLSKRVTELQSEIGEKLYKLDHVYNILELIPLSDKVRRMGGQPKNTLLGISIFISYRRGSEASYVTGRIYDRLVSEFGKDSTFKDVDSIPLGVDFRDHIERAVGKCDVFLAVISSGWHERLQDPGDFVRVELETALRRSIPVIPVFLQDAVLPAEEDLRASLRSLVYRNGLAVRPDPDFSGDMDRLIRGIGVLAKESSRSNAAATGGAEPDSTTR